MAESYAVPLKKQPGSRIDFRVGLSYDLPMPRSPASPEKPSPWRTLRRMIRCARWVLLIMLMAGAARLVQWNRNDDPRFYHFLTTPPGRALARAMQWPSFYNLPPEDKPESEFTPEELDWKRNLETALRDRWPTHRLTTTSGEEHLIRILFESPESVSVQFSFGGQSRVTRDIRRGDIFSLEPYTEPIPRITWRDVRFQMEFPPFQLLQYGPYAILTDAPYFQVIETARVLDRLYQQYMDLFTPLVQPRRSQQSLQVLFFSNEEDFARSVQHASPELEGSAGFYSPLEDRMVVFNQYHSAFARQMRSEINAELATLIENSRSTEERRSLEHTRFRVEEQIRRRGQQETLATLRHEAAHHLSYTYGVHSWFHAENGWLIEGLAVYFESDPPGEITHTHLNTLIQLRESGRIPPLAQIINIRKPSGFEAELPGLKSYEAYALSWVLFRYLMEESRRDAFFAYLCYIRDPAHLRQLVNIPREQLLARHLGTTPEALEQAWLQAVHSL